MLNLNDDISLIKGIGEKKAQIYRKMGIHTVRQLILHLPRNYLDLSHVTDISEVVIGERCLIKAEVIRKGNEQRIRKGLSLFKMEVSDGDVMRLTFYNTKFTVQALKEGQSYYFYGIVEGSLLKPEMRAPVVIAEQYVGKLMPIYTVTTGISSKVVANDIQRALAALTEEINDDIPGEILKKAGLMPLDEAIRLVHFPERTAQYLSARRRIVFEELLVFSAVMMRFRAARSIMHTAPLFKYDINEFYKSLPFTPTNDQQKAITDIENDLCSGGIMNRLVQGDVGSGKTLVAAAAAYMMFKNRRQTALMAPTELLAEQHCRTFKNMLSPFGINVELISGSMTAKQRREADQRLQSGECNIAVGTHALISKTTAFKSLGLVITDEQHRFGVAQRASLAAKGEQVHTLVMSATPIPRTLALIIYGDLDVSLIKELPPGRSPVETYRIDSPKRRRALGFIKDRLDEGRQAYIVCPLVSKDDEEDAPANMHAAKEYAKELAAGEFKDYSVGLLHGKLRPAEKEAAMADFASGKTQLLVATTVVEVGVDVPNAAVMMIENAERFGLSQLHQLRGRVGRGKHQSYCILVSDNKSDTTAQRLKAMRDTNDGFKIAEEDLRLRGPGDILGARQHGLPVLQNADLTADTELLQMAQQCAADILKTDPMLLLEQNRFIKNAIEDFSRQIGERPN
ncbi:MAG: ATP-dependent DNA helicase RecG [Oscillospiraceae bacterium]|nr:ATP-dependent DNA helicase RecG [Oscillospiraceae bacterium]MBQ4538545.1 ATP-dependent DNA helicase RecG [Oscillospiraceae bacterium]